MSDALANSLASSSLEEATVNVDPSTLQPLSPEVISKQATSAYSPLVLGSDWEEWRKREKGGNEESALFERREEKGCFADIMTLVCLIVNIGS